MKNQDEEEILRGIGASPGVAEGNTKIVRTMKDATAVDKGDILVASFTTPLFTSAILQCEAVVTDKGGVLSHAAIVSREFGIPCVVGTKEATNILNDDTKVVVDGKEGVVYGRK